MFQTMINVEKSGLSPIVVWFPHFRSLGSPVLVVRGSWVPVIIALIKNLNLSSHLIAVSWFLVAKLGSWNIFDYKLELFEN